MTFKEAVELFNDKAWMEGLGFRLNYREDVLVGSKYICAEVVVANQNGIKYPTGICLTEEAEENMRSFFSRRGITLRNNATGTVFWEGKE